MKKYDFKKKYSLREKFNLNQTFLVIVLLSSTSAGILFMLNNFYIKNINHPLKLIVYNIINVLILVIFVVPPMLYQYTRYLNIRTIENNFPLFLRNVVEGLRSGMDLPRAINYASKSDYGALNNAIKNLVNQLSWGISFPQAMGNFAKEVDIPMVHKIVATIIEAYRSGGNLSEVIDSVSQSINEITNIKKERSASVHGQIVQGYFIFIIFIAVMIGMQKFLLPALNTTDNALNVSNYDKYFLHLAIMQGLFAGLVIGKLSEGRISAGIRHSIIMMLIAYSTMTLF